MAPKEEPKPPTKTEMKALQKKDHQLLNSLKIQLQPIMDQINRRYKKFRQPVIPQASIEYLFAEADPNYVSADITEGQNRPFEIVKDKHGNDVLRESATGKCYYNLETTTIEERLSNGFYARPKDFLFDIKALAKDAKNIGDKERTLKANELLSNVEVDVASIESASSHLDWEGLYRRQLERAKVQAEKDRKRQAMQSIVDRVQSDLAAGNDSDSQGPVTLGEAVPGSRTTARFQAKPPPADDVASGESQPLSNGNSYPSGEDVQMSGVDDGARAVSDMGPPPRSQNPSSVADGEMAQVSQRSAITSLPPGVSPSAVVNDASTTRTSERSTHDPSGASTQLTNGNHGEHHGRASNQDESYIPDTAPTGSQVTSNESWQHSQAHGALGSAGAEANPTAGSPTPSSSQQQQAPSNGGGMGISGLLNDEQASQQQQQQMGNSGSSASQPPNIEAAIESALDSMTQKTSGCTIEQLEQINRELMDDIWRGRGEWNRQKVLNDATSVFNQAIDDIELMQGIGPQSQRHTLEG